MSKKTIWRTAGWPWEMELLALIFVLIALLTPLYYDIQETRDLSDLPIAEQRRIERQQEANTFQDQTNFFWGVAILGLYVVHLLFAYSALDAISTPFIHLFSPLIFAIITYIRLLGMEVGQAQNHWVTGSPGEIVIVLATVLLLTVLVARLRMARHLRRFKGIKWDITTPSVFDSTFFTDLIVTFRPLVYPPRAYRACADGILIEGWLYIYPVPFSGLKGIESVRRVNYAGNSDFYATSSKSLVRLQLSDTQKATYISPKDRDTFIQFCNRQLSRGIVSLSADREDDDVETVPLKRDK